MNNKLKTYSLVFVLWFVMFLLFYLYLTGTSSAFFFRNNHFNEEKNKWYELQTKTAKEGMPKPLQALVNKAKGQPRSKQFSLLMSAKKLLEIKNGEETYTKSPTQLLNDKTGDCDDLAYLWYRQLRQLNIPASVIYVTVKVDGWHYAHAVTLTEDTNGNPVVLDINSLFFMAYNFEKWKKDYDVKFLFKGDDKNFTKTSEL